MRGCHVLHFAGHAVLSERRGDLGQSGWLLEGSIEAPTDFLRASSLEGFWSEAAPLVVFANACVSGRGSAESLRQRAYSDGALGLAQAFLSAGVENYLGTVWESPDNEATIEFASAFYREFFAGNTIGRAVRAAREFCGGESGDEDLTWARYVLFGDPSFYIPVR